MKDKVHCQNCKFFSGISNILRYGTPTEVRYGHCHLNPPKKSYKFIEVYKTDWCGQGQPKDDDE